MDPSETENVLEGCEFFKGLEKNDIRKIAALCGEENYEAG